MNKIRVAVAGVGNCCSALVQGLHYYKDSSSVPGLTFQDIGGYRISDIDIVAAFDVDRRKVGLPLGKAIFSLPNCCRVFVNPHEIENIGPVVQKAPVIDGVAKHMLYNPDPMYRFEVDELQVPVSLDEAIAEAKPDILINYLPVGSQKATENLAEVCIRQKVAFLNCIPVFIASNPAWEQKFIQAKLPMIGDDMKSQVGSSILSQMFNELLIKRGATIISHVQENRGSNCDFANMTDRARLHSKKESKENVLRAVFIQNGINPNDVVVYAGPSNFVPLHNDYKEGIFDIQAVGFGGAPIHITTHLKVCDSENSAGVVVDAIRYLKVAREMGVVGSLRGPSAFTQKTPPKQLSLDDALSACREFVERNISHENFRS